jgi:serine/threonine protein kinase/tetratricopeptide (TPR) repeat protein
MSDELSGRSLGRYQVLERLGRGGMAEVYRAYQPSLDRFVAIKVIYPHLASDPGLRERFGREARAVAALHHPNVVQVHDFDMQGDMAFMAMEFVGGPTLKAAIASLGQRGRLLPLPVVGQIIGQIADALGYAHDQGVIHRDVKPANVLIRRRDRTMAGRDGNERAGARVPAPLADAELDELLLNLGPSSIVLSDFGVARVLSDSLEQTAAGTILGSPAYMSPEQGRGERVGPASDIYSLGVMLYELVTGRVPFDADTPFAVVIKHTQAPLPPPRVYRHDLPENLERALLKALAKEPRDRFNDAAAFGAAVREACGAPSGGSLRLTPAPAAGPHPEPPGDATRVIDELQPTSIAPPATAAPASQTQAPPATQRRSPLPWLIGGLAALLALGAIAALLLTRGAGVATAPTPQAPASEATALPPHIADPIAAALAACSAPGCPGGNAGEAINTLNAAIAAAPDSAPLYAARAQTYVWWDPYSYADQVRADVDAALERDPNNAAAYLARGDLSATIGGDEVAIDAALADLTRAIDLNPSLAAAYVIRAQIMSDMPDFYDNPSPSRDQVIADTTAALAIEPDNLGALLLRGGAYANDRQPEPAYADYSAALAIDPTNRVALMRRGDVSRYGRNDAQAALADYGAAVEAHPEYLDARRNRAFLLAELGEYEAAMPDADAMVAAGPAETEPYSFRGLLQLATGNYDAALDDFEQVLLLAGQSDLVGRYGRGKVRLEQGDPAAALPDLEAVAADPQSLDSIWYGFFQGHRQVLVDLAQAYIALDRGDEALAPLNEAIDADDGWYLPFMLRGRLQSAADPAAAREDLRRALELVGDGPERAEIEDALRQLP